jgi:hypothetical protein
MASNIPKRTSTQEAPRANKRGKSAVSTLSYRTPQSDDEAEPSTSTSNHPVPTRNIKHSALAVDAAGGTRARTKYLNTQASPEKNPVPPPTHEWNTNLPRIDFNMCDTSEPEPLDPSYVSFVGENYVVLQRKRKRPQSVSKFYMYSGFLSLALLSVYGNLGTPRRRIPC